MSQTEALTALQKALTNGAAQMNDTAAALQQAVRLLEECSMFAKPSADLQARLQNEWLPLTAHLLTRYQALSSSVEAALRAPSDERG